MNHLSEKKVKQLEIYYPFSYSKQLNHRHVFTVGDQVICEYIFAYHHYPNLKNETTPIFSEIQADFSNHKIIIKLKYKVYDNKEEFTLQDICQSLNYSLMDGTIHTKLKNLVNSIDCNQDTITISFSVIPQDWASLFTLPEFSLTDGVKQTGPYYLEKREEKKIFLRRNNYYPSELRANIVDRVVLHKYDITETDDLIESLASKHHAVFFNGFHISVDQLKKIKNQGFDIHISDDEWVLYLGLSGKISDKNRLRIKKMIDSSREFFIDKNEIGHISYSLSPLTEPCGLSREEYQEISSEILNVKCNDFNRKITVGVSEINYQAKSVRRIIEVLQRKINIELQVIPQKELSKLYEGTLDIFIAFLGIAPSDPLSHLQYLSSISNDFKEVLEMDNQLQTLQSITDKELFYKEYKKAESLAIGKVAYIPIGHYPSVIAENKKLVKRSQLSWNWGIQAWTYQML